MGWNLLDSIMAPQLTEKQDFYYHAPSQAWRTCSARGAVRVLAGPDFAQMQVVKYYDHLAQTYGRDFPNIREILQYIPLFHDGPSHKRLRRQMAVWLRHVSNDLADFEDETVAVFAEKLSQPGEVDLVSEIIKPLIGRLSFAMTGLDYIEGLAAISGGHNTLKVTRMIEIGIGQLFVMAQARFPEDDAETRGIRVALALVGAEPLGATLLASFMALMENTSGEPIAGLGWRTHFEATALQIIPRACKHQPVDLGGEANAVDWVEVDLTRFLADEGASPNHIFGAGNHICIGRGVSLSLWGRIAAEMQKNRMRVRFISAAPGKDRFLNFPSSFKIEVMK